MTYEDVLELIYQRNLKGVSPTLTEQEARQYYGEKCYYLLKKIFKFCREADYIIYQHATDLESANNILEKGFIVGTNEIGNNPIDLAINTPVGVEYSEDGVKTSIYAGEQCQDCQRGIIDELSDTQHFFENTYCNLDFGSLTDPNVNKSRVGATLLFIVPKYFSGSREYKQYGVVESHCDDWEERDVPESYFERRVIPTQFCLGYLDVKNKRFVVNPNFQFNYGITDEFVLGESSPTQLDLTNELNNNIGRKK